ncbi:uncharacterized protein QC763_503610 [Podospora pseudopauciseta]|uniref:Peptidase A1 domain-containing protein n=1 Tax=Podospora pseudopauciseta TaxID=2093780 RepID=A0ABR0H8I7_9PEZI|nr:hypothetical protein QC763_503610 [Podospora pseudopauciseta]
MGFRNLRAIQLPVALLALVQSGCCQDTTEILVEKLQWTAPRKELTAHFLENTNGPWEQLSTLLGTYDLSNITKDQIILPMYPSPWTNISTIWWTRVVDYQKMEEFSRESRWVTGYFASSWDPSIQAGARLPDWDLSMPYGNGNFTEFLHVKTPLIALNHSRLYLEAEIAIEFTHGDMLALAPPGDGEPDSRSIIQQVKDAGRIRSNSFGLYVGRPDWKLPSKMFLGGYDSNRIEGDFLMFDTMDQPEFVHQGYLPRLYLSDVTLGSFEKSRDGFAFDWATRESPNRTIMGEISESSRMTNLSLLQLPRPAAPERRQFFEVEGHIPGAALVVPDPTIPHIYLPPNTCDNAAKDLPIHWDDRLKLWLWDTSDPGYKRLMKAPAYMGFTLQNAFSPGSVKVKSLTIQVPLWLLDIEMDTRLNGIDAKLRYFPCKSAEAWEGYYKLGRAFLQSAFLGVNYDDNLFYMAQTIGPDVFDPKERLISFRPEFQEHAGKHDRDAEWIQYWASYWNRDDDDRGSGSTGSGGPTGSTGVSGSSSDSGRREMTGLILGIVAGCLVVITVGCAFYVRHKRRAKLTELDRELIRSDNGTAGGRVSRSAAATASRPVATTASPPAAAPTSNRVATPPVYKEEPDEAPPPYRP